MYGHRSVWCVKKEVYEGQSVTGAGGGGRRMGT